MMERKSTLLVIWHGALYPSYRKPFWILHKQYGFDVHLVSVKSWSKALPGKTYFQPSESEPIQVHLLPAVLTLHGACFIQPTLPWLIRTIQPDLMYVIEEPFSLIGWLTAYWCKRKVPGIPMVLYSFQDIAKPYPAPFCWFERYTLRHIERLFVSHAQGGLVWEQKGFTKLWDVVPPPVNLDQFRYKEPAVQTTLFTVGYAGRLVDEKGIDTLLWALSDLNDSVRLRLAGDGSARHRLEKMARELGVYERVAFLGSIPHERLAEFYHDCDVIVLPSKKQPNWQEQFGRVLIEAMACGTPVIGSNCGAIPEVIGNAGLLFSEGNAAMLADKIQLLQNDFKLQRDLSFRGRIRVEREFSAEKIAKKLNQHFIEVLHGANRC